MFTRWLISIAFLTSKLDISSILSSSEKIESTTSFTCFVSPNFLSKLATSRTTSVDVARGNTVILYLAKNLCTRRPILSVHDLSVEEDVAVDEIQLSGAVIAIQFFPRVPQRKLFDDTLSRQ